MSWKKMKTLTIKNEAFSRFMVSMRVKHKKKTVDIANETGISINYLYKILNGHKKTKIRDYILLICLSTGMDLAETNTALCLNDMQCISHTKRDQIIARCMADNRNIRMTNESLELEGLPELQFSREFNTKIEEDL